MRFMRFMGAKYYRCFIFCLISFCAVPTFAAKVNFTALSCDKNPIFCQILTLRPSIDKSWAYQFSNLLFKYAKQFNMDPMRSLAIAMQETSLKNQHRTRKVLVFYNKCQDKKCIKTYKEVEGASDLSIFQFHIKTIKHFDIDPLKLNNSLEYAVKSHFKLLKYKQQRCAYLKENAWACYHSKTPKYQKRYISMVNRWYPKPAKEKSEKRVDKALKT